MKPKKVKKKTTSQLKKELDAIFSIFIRRYYADPSGQVTCYTCGAKKPWKEIQNGHFVSRIYLATRFDERNCRPQCVGCNVFGGGRTAIFASNLEKEISGITVQLYKEAQAITKNYPYEEKIKYYKEKLNEETQKEI